VPTLQGASGKQIVIEGYSGNLPIVPPLSDRFPTNWNLSAARDISLARFVEPQGIDPNQLSAVTFGKYHLIASNDTPEGRAQNRRINIFIPGQIP
jgi:chemotaxis protein MotB